MAMHCTRVASPDTLWTNPHQPLQAATFCASVTLHVGTTDQYMIENMTSFCVSLKLLDKIRPARAAFRHVGRTLLCHEPETWPQAPGQGPLDTGAACLKAWLEGEAGPADCCELQAPATTPATLHQRPCYHAAQCRGGGCG